MSEISVSYSASDDMVDYEYTLRRVEQMDL